MHNFLWQRLYDCVWISPGSGWTILKRCSMIPLCPQSRCTWSVRGRCQSAETHTRALVKEKAHEFVAPIEFFFCLITNTHTHTHTHTEKVLKHTITYRHFVLLKLIFKTVKKRKSLFPHKLSLYFLYARTRAHARTHARTHTCAHK